MNIIQELHKLPLETMSKVQMASALRYAVGMLNEIYLHGRADGETHGQSDESSIAEVALEGIKKRLTGEEK